MITTEFLQEEIERMEAERVEYVTEVNRQLAALNGAIEYAKQLLDKAGTAVPANEEN